MFCKKCGNELSPSEKFCSKCGTPVAAAPSQSQGKQVSISLPQHVKSPLAIMYMIVAALHLFQLVFWTILSFKVSGMDGAKASASASLLLSNDSKAFATVFVVLLGVATIVYCVMPIMMNTVKKGRKMILPLVSSVWTLAWFIYAWTCDVSVGWASTSFTLSFCGWLIFFAIIFALILEVVVLLVSNKILALAKN